MGRSCFTGKIKYFMKLHISDMINGKIKNPKRKLIAFLGFLFLIIIFWNSLPAPLFNKPFSFVLEDKNGNLLNALIAKDGQWRFPVKGNIPDKFKTAIIRFEDKRFYYHPGVDFFALFRAAYQDIKAGKIKSGGSTITMQVIRIAREGKPRTIKEKIIEMVLAFRLELTYSKQEIISLYSAYSPFGGNVVGIEAASWRYFGRKPQQLSWAEVCMLAVLPNSPSLIHPGKNRNLLKKKRDRLLNRLYLNQDIDSLTYALSIEEPLPKKLKALPNIAPHLAFEAARNQGKESKDFRVQSTLDINIQKQVNNVIKEHYKRLKSNYVYNAAAVVARIETGDVLAYLGNTRDPKNRNENWVNVVTAPRSSGSILKPILYAAMLSSGELLPKTLVPDIPTQIGGFSPKNFNLSYDGAVPANRALARSINIPAVRLLRSYRVERFYNLLKNVGIETLNRLPGDYGLSLILGGAEVKLWEIAGVYASMARVLKHYSKYGTMYSKNDFHELNYIKDNTKFPKNSNGDLEDYSFISKAALWITFNALLDVERPDNQSYWREFSSSQKIAWKTGTSFGFRDGWAIGINNEYVVAVWTGNADGEGRTGLTGISSAAPILFDIFNILPFSSGWFEQPMEEMTYIATCKKSGYRASELCEEIDSIWIPNTGLKFPVCPYHQLIHLDESGKYRVTSSSVSPSKMIHKSWFVLPPAMEYFYEKKNHNYKKLPPFRNDCINTADNNNPMDLVYPRDINKIYIPVNLVGTTSSTIFEVAHRHSNSIIYWYVDNKYLGETQNENKMAINASKGNHRLTLVDNDGNILKKDFEILSGNQ